MTEPATTAPLYVLGVRAEKFMFIDAAELVFGADGVTQISGGNGNGKTDALTAIVSTLLGERFAPTQPIKAGEERAEVEIPIGGADGKPVLFARRTFTPSGSTLEVRSADGAKLSSPQQVLNKLTGVLCFDPTRFADPGRGTEPANNEARKEILFGICPLSIDLEKHDAAAKALADERKVSRKRAGELEVLVKADAANVPEDGEPEDESVYVHGIARIGADEELRARAAKRAAEIGKELDDLDAEIKRLQDKRRMLADAWVNEGNRSQPPKEVHDKPALEKKLAEVRARNEKRRTAAADRTRAEERAKQLLAEKTRGDALDSQLADMEAVRAQAIAAAKFPLPQLTIDSAGWLAIKKKDGTTVLFHQESKARRTIAGFVVMAANPARLRSCIVPSGNDLDDESLLKLRDLANRFGIRCLVERIVGNPEAGPVIVFRNGVPSTGGAS